MSPCHVWSPCRTSMSPCRRWASPLLLNPRWSSGDSWLTLSLQYSAPLDSNRMTWDNKRGWTMPRQVIDSMPLVLLMKCVAVLEGKEHNSAIYHIHTTGTKTKEDNDPERRIVVVESCPFLPGVWEVRKTLAVTRTFTTTVGKRSKSSQWQPTIVAAVGSGTESGTAHFQPTSCDFMPHVQRSFPASCVRQSPCYELWPDNTMRSEIFLTPNQSQHLIRPAGLPSLQRPPPKALAIGRQSACQMRPVAEGVSLRVCSTSTQTYRGHIWWETVSINHYWLQQKTNNSTWILQEI